MKTEKERNMIAELTRNFADKEKRQTLLDMLKTLDLARLADEIQTERERELDNEVLKDNFFYASKPIKRKDVNIKAGDRITDSSYAFLLSEEDAERWSELCVKKYFEAGLTDGRGMYVVPTTSLYIEAKNVLIDYIIENIIPEALRPSFADIKRSTIAQYKLIDITKQQLGIN